MKLEEKNSIIEEIYTKKRDLLVMRIKLSAGESVMLKEMRQLKKDIARLFTKLNNVKSA
jgi:ribosomal protein L29